MWVSAQPPVLCFPQSRPEARGCFSLIPLSARIRAHLPSPAKGRKVHGPLGVPCRAVRAGRRELKAFLSAVPISNPFFPPQGLPGELGQWEQGGTHSGMLKGPWAHLGMGSGRERGLSPYRSLLRSRTSISSLTGLVCVLWRAASFHGPLLQRPPCYLPQLGAPQPAPLPALFLSPSCCCCEVVSCGFVLRG